MLARQSFMEKCTPGVSRHWLWLAAGLVWSGVGIGLCLLALYWLSKMKWPANGLAACIGFGVGVIIYKFGFSRIALKNINRIAEKENTVCLFAFQAWKSYFLILFMMFLGYTLRHSHLPHLLIAIIYLCIGTALALSSSLYYNKFL